MTTGKKGTTSSYDWLSVPGGAGIAQALGKSVWESQIKWRVTPGDQARYLYKVWIKGPKGTRWW